MKTQAQKDATKKWKKVHPNEVAKHERNRQLKKLCGINLAIFNQQLKRQNFRCAICGTTNPGTIKNGRPGWHADHNHKTDKFRGILCQNCNKGLGHFQDNPMMLVAAILYLIQEERYAKVVNVEFVEIENALQAIVRSLARPICPRVDAASRRTSGCLSLRNTSR